MWKSSERDADVSFSGVQWGESYEGGMTAWVEDVVSRFRGYVFDREEG